MPTKKLPKKPTGPRQFAPAERAHWFQVQFACSVIFVKEMPKEAIGGINKRFVCFTNKFDDQIEQMVTLWAIRILALSARDAHYQLSIQMEALGWIEGQNWRVTMICPEGEE